MFSFFLYYSSEIVFLVGTSMDEDSRLQLKLERTAIVRRADYLDRDALIQRVTAIDNLLHGNLINSKSLLGYYPLFLLRLPPSPHCDHHH